MSQRRFSTFEGVFTPSLLSILGVIMYLRLGWVVGQVGLGLALVIVVFANVITALTALSMSSIVTNIRIGPGGAHSIIAKSLGIEIGGAIGIPLYLSQAVSIAFYITGFSECWISIFPGQDRLMVALAAWLILMLVSYWSARLAFRLQYVVMSIVGLSLVSILLGKADAVGAGPVWKLVEPSHFWPAFAIFFPAVTGVLSGAAMSGELKDPRKSIPLGTISAIAVSFCIYVALTFWFARRVPADLLVSHTSVVIDYARWKWLVVGGIMGATLSSALSMSVGSPRTLMALGKHEIIPFSDIFTRINKRGEPTPAILFTALLSLITLVFGTLNSVATLLTMIFLITYGMINISVFIEQNIGIASFRPSFRIPKLFPFLGGLGCVTVMFLINVEFSLIAIFLIVTASVLLLHREIKVHSPDVRSGLLTFLAENFAKAAARLPYHPKIWKPNLLVPVENTVAFKAIVPFVQAMVSPTGRIFAFSVIPDGTGKDLAKERDELVDCLAPLKEANLFLETSVLEAPDFRSGHVSVIQTLKGAVLPPNTFFYVLPDEGRDREVLDIIRKAAQEGLGIVLLKFQPTTSGLNQEKVINLWIRQQSPNLDLSILMALQLLNNWDGHLRILQAVPQGLEVKEARDYCEKLKKLMRLPQEVEVVILPGEFRKGLLSAPPADINIFGMPEVPDLALIQLTFATLRTSVLFLRDSKHESAVA